MTWWLLLLASFVLVLLFIVKTLHFNHKDCLLTQRLDGKVVVVTGCNQGIGYEVVGELARRGARVIMACRDLDKAESARSRILMRFKSTETIRKPATELANLHGPQLECELLDLQSVSSLRNFASRLMAKEHSVDILINNAAVNLRKPLFDSDGIELHLKINHLGHFLLTELIRPLLEASVHGARVINVSSFNHRLAELSMKDLCRPVVGSPYSNSKLANVIHAKEISKRWKDSNVVAVSVHPGLTKTELFRHMPRTRWIVHTLLSGLTKSPWQGSQTIVYCSLVDDLTPGAYYVECRAGQVNSQALDENVGNYLWTASEQLIKKWEAHERNQ